MSDTSFAITEDSRRSNTGNHLPSPSDSEDFINHINSFLSQHQITDHQNQSFATLVNHLSNLLSNSASLNDLNLGYSVEDEIVITCYADEGLKYIAIDNDGDFGLYLSLFDQAPDIYFGDLGDHELMKNFTYKLIE